MTAPAFILSTTSLTEFSAYWAARLTRLKYGAEGAEVHALPQRRSPRSSKARKHG